MSAFAKIEERLERHIGVALRMGGADMTRAENFYLGHLGDLDESDRARVLLRCEERGCSAQFGATCCGTNLTIKANG